MSYEFKFRSQDMRPSDLASQYEDPLAAWNAYTDYLLDRFYDDDFAILKDGVEISPAQLKADVKSYEIQAVMKEDEERLPASHRSGWGTNSDITVGDDGQPTSVWKPKNPADDYE